MRIKAFQAFRPPLNLTSQVASPPYDVLSVDEARELTAGNPASFLHITLPAIDLPADISPEADAVYEKAAENLQLFKEKGYLVQDETPCLFLYRLNMNGHIQRGVVAVSHTQDYEEERIKKHEHTRPAPEADRTRHIQTLNAQTGPVFLTYRDDAQIDTLLAEVENQQPLYDFTAPDGVQHTVWNIENTDRLVDLFAAVPVDYIADGHHRAAASARVARERREADPQTTGEEEYNWFLTVIFPARQLKILPYNRCVADLNGLSKEDFLTRIREQDFTVEETQTEAPEDAGYVCMYLGGVWYRLSWQPPQTEDPVKSMDVSVLQDRLLQPILGIDDPRKDARVSFVGGIRGTAELKKRVDSGRDTVAFSMYPTGIDQLMAVSDAGQVMPPKSTWFEPKLRSGLFLHAL
jgi:uncharacterized protein (DUF1015 family)